MVTIDFANTQEFGTTSLFHNNVPVASLGAQERGTTLIPFADGDVVRLIDDEGLLLVHSVMFECLGMCTGIFDALPGECQRVPYVEQPHDRAHCLLADHRVALPHLAVHLSLSTHPVYTSPVHIPCIATVSSSTCLPLNWLLL